LGFRVRRAQASWLTYKQGIQPEQCLMLAV
jgi:hypothetical protein